MGPVEVTAAVAVLLAAVILGVAAATAARRRARREDAEQGPDDEALRPEVLDRLRRMTAEWDGRTGTGARSEDTDVTARPDVGAWTGPSHADERAPRRRSRPLTWVLTTLLVVAVAGAAVLVWSMRS